MHIWNNIKNFLYDNDNFIAMFNNKIYLYNILKIDKLSDSEIIIIFDTKKVLINGKNLIPVKCYKKELMITGSIESVKLYE